MTLGIGHLSKTKSQMNVLKVSTVVPRYSVANNSLFINSFIVRFRAVSRKCTFKV